MGTSPRFSQMDEVAIQEQGDSVVITSPFYIFPEWGFALGYTIRNSLVLQTINEKYISFCGKKKSLGLVWIRLTQENRLSCQLAGKVSPGQEFVSLKEISKLIF